MSYFIAAESETFLQNVATIVTVLSIFVGGVVSLMAMIGKVRGDLEGIRIELQKDRQYMESRIAQLEAQVSKMRNQLTSLLLTLARNKIQLDDLEDDK